MRYRGSAISLIYYITLWDRKRTLHTFYRKLENQSTCKKFRLINVWLFIFCFRRVTTFMEKPLVTMSNLGSGTPQWKCLLLSPVMIHMKRKVCHHIETFIRTHSCCQTSALRMTLNIVGPTGVNSDLILTSQVYRVFEAM